MIRTHYVIESPRLRESYLYRFPTHQAAKHWQKASRMFRMLARPDTVQERILLGNDRWRPSANGAEVLTDGPYGNRIPWNQATPPYFPKLSPSDWMVFAAVKAAPHECPRGKAVDRVMAKLKCKTPLEAWERQLAAWRRWEVTRNNALDVLKP